MPPWSPVTLSEAQLISLCPSFIRTDRDLRITAAGPTIGRLVGEAAPGRDLRDSFRLPQPEDPQGWARSEDMMELSARDGVFALRGLVLEEPQGFLFFVRPSIDGHTDLRRLPSTLRIMDFSVSDGSLAGMLNVCMHNEFLAELDELVAELAARQAETLALVRAKSELRAMMARLEAILEATPEA